MNVPGKSASLKIAVVGAGISGMSAAWLLSRAHDVTLFETTAQPGGHSYTVEAPSARGATAVDMGFIVYNDVTYPNLVALFAHLGVETLESNMGFAVSMDDGQVEYGGDSLRQLFSQPRNLVRPRFWSMLRDLVRFYREAPGDAVALEADMTSLGDYLDARGYGRAFQEDHLLPQAAAIWSASAQDIRRYPAAAFIRFCDNHGLLKVSGRPLWRTVRGGSRAYVGKLMADFAGEVRTGATVERVERTGQGVLLHTGGQALRYDAVVMASHADQTLSMLQDPSRAETDVLGAFAYGRNHAVLHSDPALMPRRRATWSAWNYLGAASGDGDRRLCVTYWMNRLQSLAPETPLFVTLNPIVAPAPGRVIRTEIFEHPLFDARAILAQKQLWSLQGAGGVWFCGAYFGAGFHEDGLQSGLAVAEALGGVRRPWTVAGESSRIFIGGEAARAGPMRAVA